MPEDADAPVSAEAYSHPVVIPLSGHLEMQTEPFKHLPYPGFLCQTEYTNFGLSILPTPEEIQELLSTQGLTEADRAKYLETVRRIHTEKDFQMPSEPSLGDILKFCTASMWMITGEHEVEKTEYQIVSRANQISASELIDLDSPPATRCSMFNSAYAYLFDAACEYFDRSDLTERYQLISVGNIPTHQYLALVSKNEEGWHVSALDPYHTAIKSEVLGKEIAEKDTLFNKLDRTADRGNALPMALQEAAVNWRVGLLDI